MKKLLWVGDAVVSTGFARCTHRTLDGLKRRGWDVTVMGLNYHGDPHPYDYPIWPAFKLPNGDAFGVSRVKGLADYLKPDVIVIQNDPWNVPLYLKQLGEFSGKIVASMPVDGKNCAFADRLNTLDLAIWWTDFGRLEAEAGGYTGKSAVIPLGVDLGRYKPMSRQEAFAKLELDVPLDAYIVGNVNRNQPRKRLDLTVRYFCRWASKYGVDNAWLFLMVAPTGDMGYNVTQLMHYYGGSTKDRKRLILVTPEIGMGMEEALMPFVYNAFDVQLSTTQGEGWGLTTMEGMACGVPQIVPDWSALGEWARPAADLVPCSTTSVTPNYVNVLGGVMDEREAVLALHAMYADRGRREALGRDGQQLVSQPQFNWDNISARFDTYLTQVIGGKS